VGGGPRSVDGAAPGRKATGRDAGLSSAAMVAEVVATPVLERLAAGEARGVVRGATERAAYLDLDGFVVALTAPGVPLMPNGIAVARTAVPDGSVLAVPGRIAIGTTPVVVWDADDPPDWEPALAAVTPARAEALRERADEIAGVLGGESDAPNGLVATGRGEEGLGHLARAVATRDPAAAALAAERLTGLGGGLTPEGDDVLAATAAVVVAAGDAAGFEAGERARWLAALVPEETAARTTALAATLLRLAAAGRVIEPVHRLLDPRDDEAWRAALATLAATGASTGRAYATAVAATLTLLLGEA
jgi:hypothetical protein